MRRVDRRNINDGAAYAAGDHGLCRRLSGEKRATHIGGEDIVVIRLLELDKGGSPLNSGIVYQDIKSSRVFHDAIGVRRKIGRLAVAIRTFAWVDGRLHLGTGAGITWGSDPAREWDETELKVSRLMEVS